MKLLLVFLALAVGALAKKVKFNNYKVYRLVPKSIKQVETLKPLETVPGFLYWRSPEVVGRKVDIMVSPRKLSEFDNLIESLNLKKTLLIKDVQKLIDDENVTISDRSRKFDWKKYHSLDEYNKWMTELEKKYDFVEKVVIGETFFGKPITALEIIFDDKFPTVFIDAGIHAREWIGPAATSYAINKVLKSNEDSIFRRYNYVYIPIVNPDGFQYSWDRNRLWKKNRKPTTTLPFYRCHGIDLNRNFGYNWNGKAHKNHCYESYPGPKAFSEPETKAIANYLKKNKRRRKFDVFLSFHGYSEMLMYPWSSSGREPDKTGIWERYAKKAAKKMAEVDGVKYEVSSIYDTNYRSYGASSDYYYANCSASFVYMFQLGDNGKYGFLLPASLIESMGKTVVKGLETLLRHIISDGES